jgi:proteasome lid subunit RPN8/RPN11
MTSDKILLREIKRHMKAFMNACQQSKENQDEQGYEICWDDDKKKTTVKKACSGHHCYMYMAPCKKNEFGTMHSHPNPGNTIPSPGDIRSSIHEDEEAFCICNAGTKKVNSSDIDNPLITEDMKKIFLRSEKSKIRCFKLNENEKVRQDFMLGTDENQMDMIVKSETKPSEKTIYRKIFEIRK